MRHEGARSKKVNQRRDRALWRKSLHLLLRSVRRVASTANARVEQLEANLEHRADEQAACQEAGREVSRNLFYRVAAPLDELIDRVERFWRVDPPEE
jgi:hypothetical protein